MEATERVEAVTAAELLLGTTIVLSLLALVAPFVAAIYREVRDRRRGYRTFKIKQPTPGITYPSGRGIASPTTYNATDGGGGT